MDKAEMDKIISLSCSIYERAFANGCLDKEQISHVAFALTHIAAALFLDYERERGSTKELAACRETCRKMLTPVEFLH